MDQELQQLTVPAGTIIKIEGVPFRLEGDALVAGLPQNLQHALSDKQSSGVGGVFVSPAEVRAYMEDRSAPPQPAAGFEFPSEVLSALGLKDLRRVTDFTLRWNGTFGELTVTRLVTHEQSAALCAHFERKQYLLSEPRDVGRKPIVESGPDADFHPTPTFRPPAV